MKISFTGTGGTGKTTLLNELRKNKKIAEKFTFIDEITRDIGKKGFEINEKGTDETQLAIMEAHKNNTMKLNSIMDRCAVDGYAYTIWLYNHDQVTKETLTSAKETFESLYPLYDCIFFLTPEFGVVDDGVRSTSETFRYEVDDIFKTIIDAYSIPVVELTGTVEQRMNQIYDKFDKLGIDYE